MFPPIGTDCLVLPTGRVRHVRGFRDWQASDVLRLRTKVGHGQAVASGKGAEFQPVRAFVR